MKGTKRTRHRVGLALGSGAARGLAHIGVIKALDEAGIRIDAVAGTSIGAIVGACFARDADITLLEQTALQADWRYLARLLDPSLTKIRKGLIHGQRVQKLLQSLIGDVDFTGFKIPFAVVATDVNTGQEIVIDTGPVTYAVRASISIPGIFVPVVLNNQVLVDGGTTNPVPINVVRDMGATFIIAVNVLSEPHRMKAYRPHMQNEAPDIFNTLLKSVYIMEYEITKSKIMDADVVISPDTSLIEAAEFHRGEVAIAEGYRAARSVLPELLQLLYGNTVA